MKRWLVIAAVVVVVAGGAVSVVALRRENGVPSYRFATVERGSIDSVVSATGTLSAVTTVQVGTQVSGLISKLLVDFNDRVTKGQVIAQLDTTLLESNLKDAEASLERSQAELDQADRELARFRSLHAQGVSPDADLNKAQYTFDVAHAQVKSALAALDRSRQNLAYATITAPVSGIVVVRAVDVGQTVAASLQAPDLFTIAADLKEMQILAAVDESDIGRIEEGQDVRFTVKTYPDRTFTGTVKQVRLQSTIDQNIVNYTVVISVANPDGKLLPGMTATVEFVVASAESVLKVANAALRFRPPGAQLVEARTRMRQQLEARRTARAQGEREGTPPGREGGDHGGSRGGYPGAFPGAAQAEAPGDGSGGARSQIPMLYYLDGEGRLAMMPVRTGITDGQSTEVTGPLLEEGMQVIAGMTQNARAISASPFQQAQPSGPPRPPGMF